MADRYEIAERHGIPAAADQLVGETRDELEADAAARAAIAQMLGGPREPKAEPTAQPTPIAELSDEQLREQREEIDRTLQERKEQEAEHEFGQSLVGSLTKQRSADLVRSIHGEESE